MEGGNLASSNELAHLAAQHNPALPTDRRTRKELVNVFRRTGVTGLKIDAHEYLEIKCMESVANVIDVARDLAGDDPVKAQILGQRVRNYSRRLDRAQNIFGE
jgi:hypothetical protein